jgi:hypothetical protein
MADIGTLAIKLIAQADMKGVSTAERSARQLSATLKAQIDTFKMTERGAELYMLRQGGMSAATFKTVQAQYAQIDAMKKQQAEANKWSNATAGMRNMWSTLKTGNISGALGGGLGSALQTISMIHPAITAAVVGASALATAVGYAAHKLHDMAEEGISNVRAQIAMARQFEISREAVAGLRSAADYMGVGQDTLATHLGRVTRMLGDAQAGSAEAQSAFADMGLDFERLAGLGMDETFAQVADALRNTESASLRAHRAQSIFGRGYQEILPLLMRGGEFFRQQAQDAVEFGVVVDAWDAGQIKALVEARRQAADAMGNAWEGIVNSIALAAAPLITPFNEAIAEIIEMAKPLLAEFRAGIGGIGEFLTPIGQFIKSAMVGGMRLFLAAWEYLGPIIRQVWEAIVTIRLALEAWWTVLRLIALAALAPLIAGWVFIQALIVGPVLLALVMVGNAIRAAWNFLQPIGEYIWEVLVIAVEWLVDAWKEIQPIVMEVWEAVSGFVGAFIQGIKTAFQFLVDTAKNAIRIVLNVIGAIAEWIPGGAALLANARAMLDTVNMTIEARRVARQQREDEAEALRYWANVQEEIDRDNQRRAEASRLANQRNFEAAREHANAIGEMTGRILDGLQSPMDKFWAGMEEARQAFESEFNDSFSEDDMARRAGQLLNEWDRAMGGREQRFANPMTAGSSAAVSAINRFQFGENRETAQERVARLTEESNRQRQMQLDQGRESLEALRQIGRPQVANN